MAVTRGATLAVVVYDPSSSFVWFAIGPAGDNPQCFGYADRRADIDTDGPTVTFEAAVIRGVETVGTVTFVCGNVLTVPISRTGEDPLANAISLHREFPAADPF